MGKKELRFEPGLKMMIHKEFGKYLSGEFIAPINVEISPSGECGASCPRCFYRQNKRQLSGLDNVFFKESRMEGLVEELAGIGVKSISWTGGGNPDNHPSFPIFAEWAHWAKLQQGLFTNALKEVKYDPTLFEWIRVTQTNKPLNEDIIKTLRPCKTVGICINYRGKKDDQNINEAINLAERLHEIREFPEHETYVQVRPALKISGQKIDINVPDIEHPLLIITDYKFLGSNSERDYKLCEAFHFEPFIWQNGDVDICGYHKEDSAFNLGNLYSKGEKGRFRYIMEHAPKTVSIREDCQICCKLNAMNSAIAKSKILKDTNFP
jgi:sulfatase maturation enzyme AslB (radical SAM superfamily)